MDIYFNLVEVYNDYYQTMAPPSTAQEILKKEIYSESYSVGDSLVKFFEDANSYADVTEWPFITSIQVDEINFEVSRELDKVTIEEAFNMLGVKYHLDSNYPNYIFIDQISDCILNNYSCMDYCYSIDNWTEVPDKVCFEKTQSCCKKIA